MSVTRSFNLGQKHDDLLVAMAKGSGRSLTETLRRALDALKIQQDKEAANSEH